MGSFITSIKKAFDSFGHKQFRIVLIGLDGAGKTTIIYNLKNGQAVEGTSTVPSIGFTIQKIKIKNLQFTIWDIAGSTNIRKLWSSYYDNTDAIIYVVDSSNRQRLQQSKQTLQQVLNNDKISKCPILVLANKSDKSNIQALQLTQILGLNKTLKRQWYCQPCCALSGDGLLKGFQWLGKTLNKN